MPSHPPSGLRLWLAAAWLTSRRVRGKAGLLLRTPWRLTWRGGALVVRAWTPQHGGVRDQLGCQGLARVGHLLSSWPLPLGQGLGRAARRAGCSTAALKRFLQRGDDVAQLLQLVPRGEVG